MAEKLIESLLLSQKRGAAEIREIIIKIQFLIHALFSTGREDKLFITVLMPGSLLAVIMKRETEE